MKLVIISPYQFRLHRGIERFVYSLANQLARDFSWRIIIYAWQVRYPIDWGPWHSFISIRKVPPSRYFQEFIAGLCYRFWLLNDKPEKIIINFLFHGEQILPKDKPYFYVLNYPASQVPERYRKIKKIAAKFSNLNIIAVSQMVKEEASPYFDDKPISVIPNGVDTGQFLKKDDNLLSSQKLRLVSLAALEERKGIQYVIEAIKLLNDKNITYDIYGEGPYKEKLDRMIKELLLSDLVKIHPPVNNPQEVLNWADVFCLLSKGEAFPLALLEAMASGLAVVVSQYPPFAEIITPDTGIMIERENSAAVAKAIESLRDIKKRKELGKKARLRAENNFSWPAIAKKYYDLITA